MAVQTNPITAWIPVHAGSITFCHSHMTPAAMPSQTILIPGHRVPEIQSQTADMPALMPFQTPMTMLRNVSELRHASTRPATRATRPAMISPIGFADIAALRTHCAAAHAFVAPETIICHATYAPRRTVSISHCAAWAASWMPIRTSIGRNSAPITPAATAKMSRFSPTKRVMLANQSTAVEMTDTSDRNATTTTPATICPTAEMTGHKVRSTPTITWKIPIAFCRCTDNSDPMFSASPRNRAARSSRIGAIVDHMPDSAPMIPDKSRPPEPRPEKMPASAPLTHSTAGPIRPSILSIPEVNQPSSVGMRSKIGLSSVADMRETAARMFDSAPWTVFPASSAAPAVPDSIASRNCSKLILPFEARAATSSCATPRCSASIGMTATPRSPSWRMTSPPTLPEVATLPKICAISSRPVPARAAVLTTVPR